ncbi:MaoC family dehydratase [Nocardia jiangxiensis]|uniref:MaoC family dehydratase n=1 Tax=Nocardia jiangxiensis TaxID=282685 RepID=UPI000685F48C|nr:MaoC/PaaZ C-terminal domain-containing protein [Nocardia jiangxiensis]
MSSGEKPDPWAIAPVLRGQTFEQMRPGARFRTGSRTITESDLIAFVALAGFGEPLFLDEQGSVEAGYAGRIVPGTLTFAYAEGLVLQTGVLHGTGMALMGSDLSIKGPVFVGDTITVVVEVLESRPTSSGGKGVVTTKNSVVKRDGAVVLEYRPIRLVRGSSSSII